MALTADGWKPPNGEAFAERVPRRAGWPAPAGDERILMSTTPGFQQCDRIWPLVLDHAGKVRETLFATSQDIVAEDAYHHENLLDALNAHRLSVSGQEDCAAWK